MAAGGDGERQNASRATAPSRVEVRGLKLALAPGRPPPADDEALASVVRQVAGRAGISAGEVEGARLTRKSIDLRGGRASLALNVEASLPPRAARSLMARGGAHPPRPRAQAAWRLLGGPPSAADAPLVVGAGPAGLFAAFCLAEAGLPATVVERGEAVHPRARKVAALYAHARLDPESNVCFGEGGAGTFSDGKLYTRVGDRRAEVVLEALARFGAPQRILVDARPHIGTDRLVVLLAALREHLVARGTRFVFGARVDDILVGPRGARGVRLADGRRLFGRGLIVATGHSAPEMWRQLMALGARAEARPFALGFRVEHPQTTIDRIRQGPWAGHLPAADYRLATTLEAPGAPARGAWSFCMCPGGVVVPTPTDEAGLCINGMSHASRAGRFANSALVVGVTPADFARWGHHGVLAGHAVARAAEAAALAAGGGAFRAPACRLRDFVDGRAPRPLGPTSYRRGLTPHRLEGILPPEITDSLRRAVGDFAAQLPGFLADEAQLIGVETRTASPLRICRTPALEAEGLAGLYPAGEGMGWGGGIVSAAVDGMRVAEALLSARGARRAEAAAS